VLVRDALCVRPDVFKKPSNTAKGLVKVMALLQRVFYGLQHTFILLAMRVVRLLRSTNVILEVGDGMLPGLQSLSEELCDF